MRRYGNDVTSEEMPLLDVKGAVAGLFLSESTCKLVQCPLFGMQSSDPLISKRHHPQGSAGARSSP